MHTTSFIIIYCIPVSEVVYDTSFQKSSAFLCCKVCVCFFKKRKEKTIQVFFTILKTTLTPVRNSCTEAFFLSAA